MVAVWADDLRCILGDHGDIVARIDEASTTCWTESASYIAANRGGMMQRTYKARVELRPGSFENISVQAKDLMSARKLMEAQYRGMKVFSVEEA